MIIIVFLEVVILLIMTGEVTIPLIEMSLFQKWGSTVTRRKKWSKAKNPIFILSHFQYGILILSLEV